MRGRFRRSRVFVILPTAEGHPPAASSMIGWRSDEEIVGWCRNVRAFAVCEGHGIHGGRGVHVDDS